MTVTELALPGVLLIEPATHADGRGFFRERYRMERYRTAGIEGPFVQDNHSRSRRGVLRGLHFQRAHPQGKLVECVRGAVYDVVVDLRAGSLTFGEWLGVELSDEGGHQLWVPPGLAHGFCVLSEWADVLYSCTDVYHPADEGGVAWDDPDLAIAWPLAKPALSERDRRLPRLADLALADLPQVAATGVPA